MARWHFILGWLLAASLSPVILVASPKPTLFVSVAPQEYWVEKIARGRVNVESFVKSGMNAHTYEPKPALMKRLAQASLILGIGIEFEEVWFPKFSKLYPNLPIVSVAQGVTMIEGGDHDDHDGHHHRYDPHIWLSVANAKIIAQNTFLALKNMDPSGEAEYLQNYQTLLRELDVLDQEIRRELQGKKEKKFIVFHPNWGYFAKEYDLVQVPIEVDGKEPKPAAVKHLIEEAKKEKISLVFVQRGFSKKVASQIAKECGARVVETDPLNPEWDVEMRNFAKAIAGAE